MNHIAQVVLESPNQAIDHVALMKYTIGWICVGVFLFTAIVACIALLFPVIIPDARMRKWLYKFLLGEVVLICVALFSGLLQVNPKHVTSRAETAVKEANGVAEASANLNATAPDGEERPAPPDADAALNTPET
jgi:hypothetical protein